MQLKQKLLTTYSFEQDCFACPSYAMTPTVQAACLARCNGAVAEVHRHGSFTLETFRAMISNVSRSEQAHIIVSYSRKQFLQTGTCRSQSLGPCIGCCHSKHNRFKTQGAHFFQQKAVSADRYLPVWGVVTADSIGVK